MGYGEFGGGGSVEWRVVHSSGNNGKGDKHGGNGKDDDPPKSGKGIFMLQVNGPGAGNTYGPFDVDTTRILITWGPRPSAAATKK